jgi:hypothetical protein
MSAQLIVILIVTVIITILLVRGRNWIIRNRETHPEIFKNRGVIGALIWILLNI